MVIKEMLDNLIMEWVSDQNWETPYGKILFDTHEPNHGTRYHVVDNFMEFPVSWQNAIIFGKNHIGWE